MLEVESSDMRLPRLPSSALLEVQLNHMIVEASAGGQVEEQAS